MKLVLYAQKNLQDCVLNYIIAKPPGKKMQSINLMSGGEKAMTAVSLIFSIFFSSLSLSPPAAPLSN